MWLIENDLPFLPGEAHENLPARKRARLQIITKWLDSPDQAINYRKACVLKSSCLLTGSWFLEGEKFNIWKRQLGSWLWLHGIPGCGKTVLNSTIVQTLLSEFGSSPHHAVIYFYFDFRDQKVSASDMLRSFIQQLCDKDGESAQALDFLYTSNCREGARAPTEEELLATFHQILGHFKQTFLLIDALDECKERTQLLNDIVEMAQWKLAGFSVLMTSRRENDIFESLEEIAQEDFRIEIQEKDVNGDIQIWLQDQLRTGRLNKKFRKWSTPIAIEIGDTTDTG